MPKIIRQGDPTSHGGNVVSATSHPKIMGIPIALEGHKTSCGARLIATVPNVERC